MKIALLLLNNNGDVLYATPVARQIKERDFPGCRLTWIVAKQCSDVLRNNPFVDHLEIVPLNALKDVYAGEWEKIKAAYANKLATGEYDRLFILQPYEKNFLLYTTCIRKMILDAYPFPVTVPLTPLLVLSDEERANVSRFIAANGIERYQNRIVFEFAPSSGQSNISVDEVMRIAEQLVNQNPSTCVVLSSGLPLAITNPNVFNARVLTFKENAELLNRCTFLLGCSSGISWLSTSGYCKALPTVQYLNKYAPWFNSLKADFEINGFDTSHLIELYDFDGNLIVEAVNACLAKGVAVAKATYDQPLQKHYLLNNFLSISGYFFSRKAYRNLVFFFLKNAHRGRPFVRYNVKLFATLCLWPVRKIRGALTNE